MTWIPVRLGDIDGLCQRMLAERDIFHALVVEAGFDPDTCANLVTVGLNGGRSMFGLSTSAMTALGQRGLLLTVHPAAFSGEAFQTVVPGPYEQTHELIVITRECALRALREGVMPTYADGEAGRSWEIQALLGTMSDAELGRRIGRSEGWCGNLRRSLGIPRFNPPLTEEELRRAGAGVQSDPAVARVLGCTSRKVKTGRERFGIPGVGSSAPPKQRHKPFAPLAQFSREAMYLAGAGSRPDVEVAKRLGISRTKVQCERKRNGIQPYNVHSKSEQVKRLAGTDTDAAVAKLLGVRPETVRAARKLLGIPPVRRDKTPPWADRLGMMPDPALAKELGLTVNRVWAVRRKLGIPGYGRHNPPCACQGKDLDCMTCLGIGWPIRREPKRPDWLDAVGRMPDLVVARVNRARDSHVRWWRERQGIAPYLGNRRCSCLQTPGERTPYGGRSDCSRCHGWGWPPSQTSPLARQNKTLNSQVNP